MSRNSLICSGRVAIVTGGSVGLGRQMAEGLAEMGANLVLCARKKERCEQAAEELKQLGVKTLALGCDVKNPDQIRDVVDGTISRFGRIDILINNAGTSWGAPVEEMRLDHWNKVIETNLTGTFLFSQAVGRHMVAADAAGRLSTLLRWPACKAHRPNFRPSGITPARAALLHSLRIWPASGASHNIQVNAIAPGWFPTHMSRDHHRKEQGSLSQEDSPRSLRQRS